MVSGGNKLRTFVIPANAGIHCVADIFLLVPAGQWIPAVAGMTVGVWGWFLPTLATYINFYKAIDIYFMFLLKYVCRGVLSRWGVRTRSSASGEECGAPFLGVFFVLFSGTKNTPDPLVRRACEYIE